MEQSHSHNSTLTSTEELKYLKLAALRPYIGSITSNINVEVTNKMLRHFKERLQEKDSHEFHLFDVLPFLNDAAEVQFEDKFTNCFLSPKVDNWNWNFYLFPLWFLGALLRYFILLPLRSLFCLVGLILTTISLLLSDFLFRSNKNFQKKMKRRIVLFLSWIFITSFNGVIKFHGVKPKPRPNQVFVANHTTVLDTVLLLRDKSYSMVGQVHPGFLGFLEHLVLDPLDCIFFERTVASSREMTSQHIKQHLITPGVFPLLIFPEGTCVNNKYCVMFKKGAFELGASVCPIAVRYNSMFCDPFWNSSRDSFFMHLVKIWSSWAMVCDVYYLEPQDQQEGESTVDFCNRVKAMIARKAKLVNVPWDGYYKYFHPNHSFLDARQKIYAESFDTLIRTKSQLFDYNDDHDDTFDYTNTANEIIETSLKKKQRRRIV